MSSSPPPELQGVPPGSGPPRKRRGGTWLIALIVVAAMVLTTIGAGLFALFWLARAGDDEDPKATEATVPMPDFDPSLSSFYGQRLRWQECGLAECTKLTVPRDYADPDGAELELAVIRVKATKRDERVGQLVVNPGGPGGSGVDYAAGGALQWGQQLSRRYDIVGFDPRGVGRSTPLTCGTTAERDALVSADADPETPAEVTELRDLTAVFAENCMRAQGDLAAHMSTIEVAKDLDVLRHALGEHQLDYFGASYGTLIGATYAELFPGNVRRMVLDGAVDPALSSKELSLEQARGFETALAAYAKDCAGDKCALGATPDQVVGQIRALLDRLDRKPLPTDGKRRLTKSLAARGVWMPLYVSEYWSELTAALEQAIDKDDGTALLKLADLYLSRGPTGYRDNSMPVLYAVNCLDHSDSIRWEEVPTVLPEFEKASPTFGAMFAYDLASCSSWPLGSTSVTKAMDAAGANPILVLGTSRDPATPLIWAEALAEQLDSAVLISRDGDGHTAFNMGNRCVDDTVTDYLIQGRVPTADSAC